MICKFFVGENNNTKKICRYCGKELENTLVSEPNNLTEKAVVCSSCGNTILNGKSFCSKCGKKVN